jgi:halimadienyl-diphosphate synthase
VDFKTQALELVGNLAGRTNPSAYDTAWMARIPADGGNGARWPELLDWLVEHQWPDGSWGGTIPYYHDRIICTLAVIIALEERAEGRRVHGAIRQGERFIWQNLHRLRHDPYELIGFELILPTLLMDALEMGLDVPAHTCGYGQVRLKKLGLIPPNLIYSPQISTVHSLEFLGKSGEQEKLREAKASNGSLGNSPAATAYLLLMARQDDRALGYLEDVLRRNHKATYLHPWRMFELTWVLHSLTFCGEALLEQVDECIWSELRAAFSERGAGLDPSFGVEDGDITSVTARLLTLGGFPVDTAALMRFENEKTHTFRTYGYERNISLGTNVHALEAVALLADYPGRQEVLDRVVALLLTRRIFDTYWIDKWHTSPYYATAHVLVGLLRVAPTLLEEYHRTVDWLLHTQREDGSWGFFDRGTVEETAYVLIALLHFHRHCRVDRRVLDRGARFLQWAYLESAQPWPELWVGKSLFIPEDVVQAAVLSAMILYEETFGWLPG